MGRKVDFIVVDHLEKMLVDVADTDLGGASAG